MKLTPEFVTKAMEKMSPWLAKAFSDNGTPSSSRLLTLLHSLVGCGVLIYVIVKTHLLPDGTTLAGLGAFSTAHYAVNRATNAWGKDKNVAKPDGDDKVSQ
jgi:hypothetical protein